jgi:hypothetical protein
MLGCPQAPKEGFSSAVSLVEFAAKPIADEALNLTRIKICEHYIRKARYPSSIECCAAGEDVAVLVVFIDKISNNPNDSILPISPHFIQAVKQHQQLATFQGSGDERRRKASDA